MDIATLHNTPRFRRDPDGIYAQIVYAAKATDVTDVMVNGNWLMRQTTADHLRKLKHFTSKPQNTPDKIDTFLLRREKSVLSKLIAIGGAMEEESFEVQTKVRITEPEPVLRNH